MTRTLADDVELAFERIGDSDVLAAPDEHLADHRLDFPDRIAESRIVAGHVAPTDECLPFFLDRTLDFVFASQSRRRFLGQEHHADAILSVRRQLDVLPGHFFAQERVRNLQQDAGTVASKRIGADRASMRQILEYLQPLLDDGVGFLALDMGDETDAAGVVFIGRIVESLGKGRLVQVLPLVSKKAGWAPTGCGSHELRANELNIQPAGRDCKALKNCANSVVYGRKAGPYVAPRQSTRLNLVDREQTTVFANRIAIGHAGDVIGHRARGVGARRRVILGRHQLRFI